MKKKILIIDDSALMRRVFYDIINSDDRFEVVDTAKDGAEGFKLIVSRKYDAVVLDVYMPRMTGLEMLKEMQASNVHANVLMASTTTGEGEKETLTALELGAIDFIKKPENVADARMDTFKNRFLQLLDIVANAGSNARTERLFEKKSADTKAPTFTARYDVNFHTPQKSAEKQAASVKSTLRPGAAVAGRKIVAIASSTGGPKALQLVIPKLPKGIKAPILLVQHMPKGFTRSLAERLNELSEVSVSEAKTGDPLMEGHVYVAPGGQHLKVEKRDLGYYVNCTDEPSREGVKPCANYMFESLCDTTYDEVVCVVLTGMGSDGTAGIKELDKKKNIHVIAQDEDSSTVYGMPKSIAVAG
ncbi:MAG TPA: chemotaxis-specific protein-glutamate methyltransferase CheB, partial [Lachnospiraceae bacterium]|nr:chemotaxis-specific protein-glutamate methyltransferase CheB [Lachnospiraceae bacterium]